MPNTVSKLIKKYCQKLRTKINSFLGKYYCLQLLHTKPYWVWDKSKGSQWQTYQGVCRNCGKAITTTFRYDDGPLVANIPRHPKTGNRNIEALIQSCVQMFLQDGAYTYIPRKGDWMDLI